MKESSFILGLEDNIAHNIVLGNINTNRTIKDGKEIKKISSARIAVSKQQRK